MSARTPVHPHGQAERGDDRMASMIDTLIHWKTFARLGEQLKAFAHQVRPLVVKEGGEIEAAWGDALDGPPAPRIVFANTDVFFGGEVQAFMAAAMATPELDWFQSSAAGVEHPILAAFGKKANLYTSCHEQAHTIAEWCLWQALDFFRDGRARRRDRAAKDWTRRPNREIAESTWLIYGFGRIGWETGRRVRALGGHVIGVRRSAGPHEHADEMISPGGVLERLNDADVVLLTAPHTPETEGLADAAFFAAMGADALFMNVGRGALVVEADLLNALDAGRPAFAALDVFVEEPLPAASPFWTHPKVAMTPHNSVESELMNRRVDGLFLANLERFLADAPLDNVVPRADFGA